jgi:hypothetical protein
LDQSLGATTPLDEEEALAQAEEMYLKSRNEGQFETEESEGELTEPDAQAQSPSIGTKTTHFPDGSYRSLYSPS